MELKPMKRYPKPDFATKNPMQAHPEMMKLLPKRWRNSTLVALLVLAMTVLSSSLKQANGADLSWWVGGDMYFGDSADPYFELYSPNFNIPVLFDPSYKIIKEELIKADIELSTSFQLRPINAPATHSLLQTENTYAPSILVSQPLGIIPSNDLPSFPYVLDGEDSYHRIAFEFVSQHDAETWGYDTPESAAQALTNQLSTENPLYHYAVFTETDRETLHFQVQCFIEWLKVQGVI